MPQQGSRLQAPIPPQLPQGPLEGEEGVLGAQGLVQQALGILEHDLQEGAGQPRVESLGAAFQGRSEDGLGLVELPAHPGMLGALAREEQGHPGRLLGLAHPHPGRNLARVGPVPQVACGLGRVVAEQGQAMGQVRATARRRVAERPQVLVALQGQGEVPGLPAQGLQASRRERQEVPGAVEPRRRGGLGGLLQHQVDVGPRDAEGADARQAGARTLGPGKEPIHHPERQLGPGDQGIWGVEVQVGRQPPVAQGQDGLDQPGHPRRALGVSDLALDRAHQQGLLGRTPGTQGGTEGLQFQGIAQRGSHPVGFDVVHLPGLDPGPLQGPADHRLLGGTVGGGQAVAPAVLVGGASPHQGQDPVAVVQGRRQGLEDHQGAAVAADVAVGGGVEDAAASAGREGSHGGHDARGLGREDQVHAPGQRQVAFPLAKGLTGQVDGQQRGGAGGVQGQGRTLQPQLVGQPPGRHAGRHPGAGPGVHLAGIAQHGEVVQGAQADEDPGGRPLQAFGRKGGVLQGLPGGLQQEALLGIHHPGFPRRDPEERGVESVDIREEAAPAGHHAARDLRVGVVQGPGVPALGRDLGDGVPARDQEFPEGLRALGAPRIVAADPDQRDGFAMGRPRGGRADRNRIREVPPGRGKRVHEPLQEGRLLLQGRLVEGQGGRQVSPQGLTQRFAQFQGHQRVQPVLAQGPPRVQVRRREAQDSGSVEAHQSLRLLDGGLRLLHGEGEELGQEGAQLPAYPGAEGLEVHLQGQHASAASQQGLEEPQPFLGLEEPQALALQSLVVFGSKAGAHADRPGAPAYGQGGKTFGPAGFGQGRQKGVGRRVVGLPGAAQGGGH